MSDEDSNTLDQNDDNANETNQQTDQTLNSVQNVSRNPNDPPPNTNISIPPSPEVVQSHRRTGLHPLEEVELKRRVKKKRTSSANGAQPSSDENHSEQNSMIGQQNVFLRQSKNAISYRASSVFEGYSSVTSNDSRYLDSRHTNEKLKSFMVFLYTEPSIMFYSNTFLMICSIILMNTSDKYISNLDITRTFLNLDTNKTILYCLYSGFLMMFSCICALYSALTISGVMIVSGIFQLGLGITIINRIADQQTMVKTEMKLSFSNYGIHSDVTQGWDSFQSELSCCGLHGGNSYKAKRLPIPESCYKDKYEQHSKTNDFHMGCFGLVKKLEEKFLNPVIVLTLFCSFLQMSNGILILNLLRPKPKPRRYHIAYRRTQS